MATGRNSVLEFDGNCRSNNNSTFIRFISRSTPDDGEYVINASQLLFATAGENNDIGGCDYNVHLKRSITGTLDPNYGEGGYIYGIQKRSISISIAAVQ